MINLENLLKISRFFGTILLILLAPLIHYGIADAQYRISCKLESLPIDVQNQLKTNFSSWKIQELANLSQRAHERWESEKPQECPGIAIGYFESTKALSYAVLIVPMAKPNEGYKFLIFSRQAGPSMYESKIVDGLDRSGSTNYFIHRASIRKFFDTASMKKFQAHAVDGILLIDAAENEYGVEIYFWSEGHYRHEPLDY